MKLEENFHIDEFKCRDGSSVPEEHIENIKELAKNLQVLRDYIDKPIVVISGYRSLQYNTSIGSKPTSQHVKSKAADIIVSGMTPLEVDQRGKNEKRWCRCLFFFHALRHERVQR